MYRSGAAEEIPQPPLNKSGKPPSREFLAGGLKKMRESMIIY
jgi:hypothetical protein